MRTFFLVSIFLLAINSSISQEVNLPTGGAKYSIPLYSYNSPSSRLATAFELFYTAGNGIRANDIPSSVGSGWEIIGGGFIERVQNGEPDDQKEGDFYGEDPYAQSLTSANAYNYINNYYPDGYMYSQADPALQIDNGAAYTPLGNAFYKGYKQLPKYLRDSEIDEYRFKFNNYEGSFVIGRANAGVKILNDSKLKVEYIERNMTANRIITRIAEFHITDEYGIKYVFKDLELSTTFFYDKINISGLSTSNSPVQGELPPSSFSVAFPKSDLTVQKWYLSEIVNGLTGEKIVYKYSDVPFDMPGAKKGQYVAGKSIMLTIDRYVGVSKRLDQVLISDSERVDFNYSIQNRQDIPSEKALVSLTVKKDGEVKYSWNFSYGYFVHDKIESFETAFDNTRKYKARLALLSVKKKGKAGTEEPPFQFEYNIGDYTYRYLASNGQTYDYPTKLYVPSIHSFYVDHFGYSNDTYETSLESDFLRDNVPANIASPAPYIFNTVKSATSSGSINYVRALNYISDFQGTRNIRSYNRYAGTLKSVKSPLGGQVKFEYEDAYPLGGVRVGATYLLDETGRKVVKEYKYVKGDGSSSHWGPQTFDYKRNIYTEFITCSESMNYVAPLMISKTLSAGLKNTKGFVMSNLGKGVITPSSVLASIGPAFASAYFFSAVAYTFNLASAYAYTRLDYQEYSSQAKLSGSPLIFGYSSVEVLEKNGTAYAGKTVYDFTSDSDYPFLAPTLSVENSKRVRYASWAYREPKMITVLDNVGNVVKKSEFKYNMVADVVNDNRYLSRSWMPNKYYYSCDKMFMYAGNRIDHDFFYPVSGRMQVVEKIETDMQGTNAIVTRISLEYSPTNYLINKTRTTNSKNEIIERRVFYQDSYSVNDIINKMRVANIVSVPILTQEFIKKDETFYLRKASVNEFSVATNGDIKVAKTYSFKDGFVPESQVPFSSTAMVPGYVSEDLKLGYDDMGMVNHLFKLGESKVIVNNRRSKLPALTVTNAMPNEAFYEGFEQISWTGADGLDLSKRHSGVASMKVTGSPSPQVFFSGSIIPVNTTSARKFRLSTWVYLGFNSKAMVLLYGKQNGQSQYSVIDDLSYGAQGADYNQWRRIEKEINVPANMHDVRIGVKNESVDVTSNTWFDEIVFTPASSFFTVNEYDVFGNLSYVFDESGRYTEYEYDYFNRLSILRDQQGRVIKKICYNYAGQPEACGTLLYKNLAQSGTFVRNNCGAGYIGGATTYTVPAGTYTSTVSQADADQQAQSAVNANGQSYANSNGACTSASCSFTAVSNWLPITGNIINNNSVSGPVITFNLTVKYLGTSSTNWGAPVIVATINGPCAPAAGIHINFFAEGRNWMATITPYGQVLLQLQNGFSPSAGTSIAIPLSMYPQYGYEY